MAYETEDDDFPAWDRAIYYAAAVMCAARKTPECYIPHVTLTRNGDDLPAASLQLGIRTGYAPPTIAAQIHATITASVAAVWAAEALHITNEDSPRARHFEALIAEKMQAMLANHPQCADVYLDSAQFDALIESAKDQARKALEDQSTFFAIAETLRQSDILKPPAAEPPAPDAPTAQPKPPAP